MTTSAEVLKRNSKFPQPPLSHNLDSSFYDPTNSETGSVRALLPLSLLDEEDECKLGEVLQPQVKVSGVPKEVTVGQHKNEEDKEEEDWNW